MATISRKSTLKIFCDVNIFQDVLSGRPGVETSLPVLELVRQKEIKGACSVFSIPILWYLNRKTNERQKKIRLILEGFEIVSLDQSKVMSSLATPKLKDLEDELQYQSAEKASCHYLITRNIDDFVQLGELPILLPEDFLGKIS